MISKDNIITVLWIVFSSGTILISKFDERFNQVILKVIIPSLFVIMVILEKGKLIFTLPLIIYIVFALWATLSLFYSVNFAMTTKYLQQIAGNIIIWYIVNILFLNFTNKKLFFYILVFSYLFHAFYSVIFLEIDEITLRRSGLYKNSNALGFTIYYGIFIMTFFYLTSRFKFFKTSCLILILMLIAILLDTGSRKSVLAMFTSFIVILLYIKVLNYKKILLLLGLIFIGYFNMKEFVDSSIFGQRMESESIVRSTNIRSELITEGTTFFVENPFLGIGLGSFTTFSNSGLMSHNDYIEILSSMGLIGLILYLSIFFLFYKDTKLLLKFPESYTFGIIGMAFLAGYLLLGMGRPAFLDPTAIIIFASFHSWIEYEVRRIKMMY